MKRVVWAVAGVCVAGAVAGTYVVRGGLGAHAEIKQVTAKPTRASERRENARDLDRPEAAILTRAFASGRVAPLADSESGPSADAPLRSPHVTELDEQIRIPANDEAELGRMAKALDLNAMQQKRVKSLVQAFAGAQKVLEKYREPLKTEKRYELQRQFRLSMHTALPKSKEDAADKYLSQPR